MNAILTALWWFLALLFIGVLISLFLAPLWEGDGHNHREEGR